MTSPKRVLILGASGLVGGCLLAWWGGRGDFEVIGTYFRHPVARLLPLDIRDGREVDRVICAASPDVVALPASNPFVDYCEMHPAETRETNVAGSRNVIDACRRAGAKLIFFSSDYVFDGQGEPYREEDPTRPMNEYGRQKVEVERAVQETLEDFLIVRLSGVFGWETRMKNFVVHLLTALGNGRPIQLPADQVYNPTYAPNMADLLAELTLKRERGIFHVVGADRTTRYAFGRAAAEVFGLDTTLLVPVTLAELGSPTPRPLRTGLLTDKVRARVSTRLWGIRESLEHMRQARSLAVRAALAQGRCDG